MTQKPPLDPYIEAKLFGILLAGAFAQTRSDCSPEARLRLELAPGSAAPWAKRDDERKA